MAFPVFGLQFVDITEVESALGTGFYANRLACFGKTVGAGIALGHSASRLVELRSMVGAGGRASPASDAFLCINEHQAAQFGMLGMSFCGTNFNAGWIVAVVARHGNVTVMNILVPRTAGAILPPASAFIPYDSSEKSTVL